MLCGDVNKDGQELGPDGRPLPEPAGAREPTDISVEHHVHFLKMIATAAGLKKEDLVDLDLYLYDSNPAVSFQPLEKFIYRNNSQYGSNVNRIRNKNLKRHYIFGYSESSADDNS